MQLGQKHTVFDDGGDPLADSEASTAGVRGWYKISSSQAAHTLEACWFVWFDDVVV